MSLVIGCVVRSAKNAGTAHSLYAEMPPFRERFSAPKSAQFETRLFVTVKTVKTASTKGPGSGMTPVLTSRTILSWPEIVEKTIPERFERPSHEGRLNYGKFHKFQILFVSQNDRSSLNVQRGRSAAPSN